MTLKTKLTLRLEEPLIQRAKEYAARSGTSVSRLVADHFALLGQEAPGRQADSPRVAQLRGALRDAKLSRADYLRYLERKHR